MTKEVAEARRSAADFRYTPKLLLFAWTFLVSFLSYRLASGSAWSFPLLVLSFWSVYSSQKILQDQAECDILMARFKREEAAYLDQFQKHEGKE